MTTVSVVGAGSWGTAFSATLARNGVDVLLWARRGELADRINREHRNDEYLPEIELPSGVRATSDLEEAVRSAPVVVLAVPSHAFRATCADLKPLVARDAALVSLAKGIERETLLRMSEVAVESAGIAAEHVAVLSGPNLAREVARGLPVATVVACPDDEVGRRLQRLFHSSAFRVYTNTDVCGVEVGGATKNVVAIAAGVAAGFGYGDNALAALVTRGLVEITRLGVRLGAQPLTFAGLAGVGDLVATCASKQSRNHYVGEQLAAGRGVDEIVRSMNQVAEGVTSCAAVLELARRAGCDMPIAERVGKVLYEGADVRAMVDDLLLRAPEPEFRGIQAG